MPRDDQGGNPSSGVPHDQLVVPSERSGKVLVVVFVIFAVGVALYFALGMPGMDHGSGFVVVGLDMSSGSGRHRLVSLKLIQAARQAR
ncbi:MAG: hypothetical protein ABI808_06650 [Pseudonocardiales bacterium]